MNGRQILIAALLVALALGLLWFATRGFVTAFYLLRGTK